MGEEGRRAIYGHPIDLMDLDNRYRYANHGRSICKPYAMPMANKRNKRARKYYQLGGSGNTRNRCVKCISIVIEILCFLLVFFFSFLFFLGGGHKRNARCITNIPRNCSRPTDYNYILYFVQILFEYCL